MTKLHTLVPVALLALAPAAALADDYRFEVRGSFDRQEFEGAPSFYEPEALSLSGSWYFEPVSTDGVPLAEAAYLGRASSLSAAFGQVDLFGTHLESQGAHVGYYIPNTMFYAAAGVTRRQEVIALNSTLRITDHRTTWSGTLGVAPIDGLLITTDFQEGGYDPNVTARHVGKLPNGHFYAGGVRLADPDFGDLQFGLDFDYYFDDTTSLGASYDDEVERFELRAEKFFSKSWAAGVSVHTEEFGDGFGVHVTWRH